MLEGHTLAAKRNSKSRPGVGWVHRVRSSRIVGEADVQLSSLCLLVGASWAAGGQCGGNQSTLGLCGKGAEIEEYWNCCL